MVSAQLPLDLQLHSGHRLDTFYSGVNGAAFYGVNAVLSGVDAQCFIAGAGGSGKTHLLEGSVHYAQQQGLYACLVPAKEIRQLPPEALDDMEQFDLLAIDDADELVGHAEWEEALFHLYNRLMARDGRLLVAGPCPPAQLGIALPDLATRWAAGPVYQLQAPSEEQLASLLYFRMQQLGLHLEQGVSDYILLRSKRTINELVGIIERLDSAAMVEKRALTVPFVKMVMGW